MQDNLDSAQKVFVIGSIGDPRHGWGFCETCSGECGRVVHYIPGWGWLGHATHFLEVIPIWEVHQFGLDAPGLLGRKRRLAYCSMRAKYSENPERFIREVLVLLSKSSRRKR
jgi:hypothetical protein